MLNILLGFTYLALNKLNLLNDKELFIQVQHRKSICNDCQIKKNNWCDRKKGGCGCFLPASWFAINKKCHVNKWKI